MNSSNLSEICFSTTSLSYFICEAIAVDTDSFIILSRSLLSSIIQNYIFKALDIMLYVGKKKQDRINLTYQNILQAFCPLRAIETLFDLYRSAINVRSLARTNGKASVLRSQCRLGVTRGQA